MAPTDVTALLPASRIDDDGRVVVTVDGRVDVAIELAPRPGVVCRADLPDLDGYWVEIAGATRPGSAPPAGAPAMSALLGENLRVATDDVELTWSLLDDLRAELLVLPGRGLRLHVEDDVAEVRGRDLPASGVATAVGLLAVVCARPVQLARRLGGLYRRWGGVASGSRWNAVDFRITLATTAGVTVDWPRRRGPRDAPGLVTRLRVESPLDLPPVHIVDTGRETPPAGFSSPIMGASPRAGRYHVVSASAAGVATALTMLDPTLGILLDALPRRVDLSASGVEVLYGGIELQRAAIEPGITLARALAGDAAQAAGPYR